MFQKPTGMPYVRFLRSLHKTHIFETYMEIGCRTGRTLSQVRGRTIAVDPYFKVTSNIIQNKPALHIFQKTSDAFFQESFLEDLSIQLSFSFLDGMHLVEFLLRDVINTEKNSKSDGLIALHDCVPFNHEMTSREIGDAGSSAWTGDVWKLIPILQHYRPDLKIDVLDCQPTGLVLLSGLDPENTTLADKYDEIISDWLTTKLSEFDEDRFFDLFEYRSAWSMANSGFAEFSHLSFDQSSVQLPQFVSP